MFPVLGRLVARFWLALLVGWAAVLAAAWFAAPSWDRVGTSGQLAFLPADAPTRRAEAVFDRAFPGRRTGSAAAVVVTRPDGPLTPADHAFIDHTLAPRVRAALLPGGHPEPDAVVTRVRAPGDGPTGVLLTSPDHHAALVVAEMTPEFFNVRVRPAVDRLEALVGDLRPDAPAGLDLALAGSAVLGRDTGRAEDESAHAVRRWTLLAVAGLLLVIYRAPLLAVIPLATVAVGIEVALRLLGALGEAGHLHLFKGVRLYVTVIGYGAGVDYCLFLIARTREEWAGGAGPAAGAGAAVAKVGPAVAASAATVALGMGMLGFADFGKLRQAGLGIALSLGVVFAAALTLAPALLALTGRWALWPHRPAAGPGAGERFWGRVGRVIGRHPGLVWAATVAALVPFAAAGALSADLVSYDLTRNVPPGAASTAGEEAIKAHFPAGEVAPVTVLLKNDRIDFRSGAGAAAVEELTRGLEARAPELGLADVRSAAAPLGTSPAAQAALARLPVGAAVVRRQALDHYVGAGGHVARLDLVLDRDPFDAAGLRAVEGLGRAVAADLPDAARAGTAVHLLGAAAGMRDLAAVTTADRWRVDGLVTAAVAVVLLVLLRRPVLSGYLVLTVVLGYLTTLGVTVLAFAAVNGPGFPGPDWKVPFFLFTILVAVGADYNIFLVARVREEEARRRPAPAVAAALARTGGVITSCGVLMAGTFSSLFAGSLGELRQMGFALAFGVLLDTLVVRPVLVPAFLFFRARRAARRRPAPSPAPAVAPA